LNAKAQKRFSHGLNFMAAYTLSKKIDNAATAQLASQLLDPIHISRPGLVGDRIGSTSTGSINSGANGTLGAYHQDPANESADRAVAVDDITHVFNLAASCDFPVGRG
jgi:hypothetical protein